MTKKEMAYVWLKGNTYVYQVPTLDDYFVCTTQHHTILPERVIEILTEKNDHFTFVLGKPPAGSQK